MHIIQVLLNSEFIKRQGGLKNIIEKVYQLNRSISSFTPKKITIYDLIKILDY